MNTVSSTASLSTARIDARSLAAVLDAQRAAARIVAQAPRREHRTRDFGIGYGSSSGYATARRYADNWGNARFTCG